MSRRLGFLWVYPQENGEVYMTGFLEDLQGEIAIKVTKNLDRQRESHAPYVILRRGPLRAEKEEEEKPKEFLI